MTSDDNTVHFAEINQHIEMVGRLRMNLYYKRQWTKLMASNSNQLVVQRKENVPQMGDGTNPVVDGTHFCRITGSDVS